MSTLRPVIRRVLRDLLAGRNLDSILALVAAIAAAILGPLGLVSSSVQSALLLAVLALLAVSTLVDRANLDDLRESLSKRGRTDLFRREFDEVEFSRDLSSAQELWLMGASLGGFANPRFAELEAMVRQGMTIRVLVIDPEDTSILTVSERRAYGNPSVSRAASKARATLEDFESMRQRTGGAIEIRVVDYPIPHRVIAINPNAGNGKLYVSEYLFQTPGGTVPKFVLDSYSREWFELYRSEAENLWRAGRAYV